MSTHPRRRTRAPVYDAIGRSYVEMRRPDPRIAAAIHEALGTSRTVVNVGAGTGSYEPDDRWVLAVEPSEVMIRQRPPDSAPAIVARAEALPLADASVDAAMAILSLHHWTDWCRGLNEMRRVARERVVLFTWDPSGARQFWLTRDYLSWLIDWDARRFPTLDQLRSELPAALVERVAVPADCVDGFLAAFWARPEAYLDPAVQRSNSLMALAPDRGRLHRDLDRLRSDLATGAWDARYGEVRSASSFDAGYVLVTATLS